MSFKGFISLALLHSVISGIIKSNAHQYINLSTSSPQLSSVYIFDFTLPSFLPQDATITIAYPPQSYNAGLATSKSLFKTYYYSQDITHLTTLNLRTFTITLNRQLQASSVLKITIDSLFNPFKSGGTGNFIITTIDKLSNIIDQSMAFGSIGISEPSLNLTDLTATFSSTLAGQSANITFSFTNLVQMKILPEIYITFPQGYDTTYVSSCQCQFSTICSHQSTYVSLTNFDLKKGQNISCLITNITNPKYQVITQPITFYLRTQSSSAIQQSGNLPPNNITANKLNLTVATNQTLFDSIVRTIRLGISSINPYSSMKIVMPMNITAVRSAMSFNSTILYNVIQLANITSQPSAILFVDGLIQQQIGYLKTQMVEVYAYHDNNYEYLVAYSQSTTQFQPRTGSATTSTVSQSNSIAKQNNTISVSFAQATQIAIQMPQYTVLNCSVPCEFANDTLTMNNTNAVTINAVNPRLSGHRTITVILNGTRFSQHQLTYSPYTLQTPVKYMYNVGYVIQNSLGTMRVYNQQQYGCYNQCTVTHSYIEIQQSNIILTEQSPITIELVEDSVVQATLTLNTIEQFNIEQHQLDDLYIEYRSWKILSVPQSDWISIFLPGNLTINNPSTIIRNGVLVRQSNLNISLLDGYANQSTMVITTYSNVTPTRQYSVRILSVVSPVLTTLLTEQYASHPFSNYTFQHNATVHAVIIQYPPQYDFTTYAPETGMVLSSNSIQTTSSVFGVLNPLAGNYTLTLSYIDKYNQTYYQTTIHYTVMAALSLEPMTIQLYPNHTDCQVGAVYVPLPLMPKSTIIQLLIANMTYGNMTPHTDNMQLLQHTTDTTIRLYNLTISHTNLRVAIKLTYRNIVYYQDSQDITTSSNSYGSAVVTLQQDPMNSAEVATYTISLDRVAQSILLTFDQQYMLTMTPRNKVYASQGVPTIYNRNILIKNINNNTVSIFGIVNPNRYRMASAIAVSLLNDQYNIIASSIVSTGSLIIPPKIMEINFIRRSSSLARYVSTYYFGITIPYIPSGATILIDFPEEYWVDSFSSCRVDDTFSLDTYCTINGFRMSVHTNHVETVNTPITIQVDGIRNPQSQGTTSNFVISIHHQQKILSRSYGNISPSYVTSSYSALDIPVNSQQPIYLEKGILSDVYRIEFDGGAKAPITLTPNILSKSILIIPNFLQIQIGDLYAEFRMAASNTTEASQLLLNWTKTNDHVQPLYMPLYRSPVYLMDTIKDKVLRVTVPEQLYQNGSTFSYDICSDNPPYDGLTVSMTMDKCHLVSNISEISLYSQCVKYSIMCPISVIPGHTTISLSSSRQQYRFPNQSITVPLMPYQSTIPAINSISIVETTRATIKITVDSPDMLKLVYVIADCGHRNVSFLQVYNQQSQQLNFSNPRYSTLQIHNGISNHTITGLLSSHCYKVTLFQLSMFTVQNDTPIILQNNTKDGQKSVFFTLPLRQTHLLEVFQKEYLLSIFKILAIDKNRVVSDQCNKTLLLDSLLHWNIIIRGNNTNQNINVDPVELITYLNRSQETLRAYLPNLIIQPIPYRQHTLFTMSDVAVAADVSSITMTISQMQCYTIVATLSQRISVNSTVFQVSQHLAEDNMQTMGADGLIDRLPYSLAFSNLKNNTAYTVQYIVYRPQLEYNLTVWPSIRNAITMNYKQFVDINSIYISAKGISVGIFLILLLV